MKRAIVLATISAALAACGGSSLAQCRDAAPHLVVSTAEHQLLACNGRQMIRTYGVRLSRGGLGKEKEGDKKVPLGRYQLGQPLSSEKFGLFIPVGYPTSAQRRAGFTGGAIGVHGPHRAVAWLGRLTNVFDTTDGCIGIATDGDMRALADWVRRYEPRYIEIVPRLPPKVSSERGE